MKNRYMRKLLLPAATLLCALLLCGCSARQGFENGSVALNARSIRLRLEPGETELLNGLTQLEYAELSGSECYEEIAAWAAEHPRVAVSYSVPLPDGRWVSSHVEELDLSALPYALEEETARRIKYLPDLRHVDLGSEDGGGISLKHIAAFGQARGDIEYDYTFSLCGEELSAGDRSISLVGATRADIQKLKLILPLMNGLESLSLGTRDTNPELDFKDIAAFERLRPEAELEYSFELFGRSIDIRDKELNFSHVPMDDEGAAVLAAALCMPELERLDMDFCGVSNEAMAEIRDALPDTEVIWRIWFGDAYSVRTDVEKILASKPTVGGDLNEKNTEALKYCTKVKYLDLGHNATLEDISFVQYMPELEVAVLSISGWGDASPLASCPHLEYLEIQNTRVTDLTPLAGLKELKHLNVAYLFELDDISPLYGLTQLERLWIGCLNRVPAEQIEHMRECAPDCEINTTVSGDPTGGTWRYSGRINPDWTSELSPRYALLREQFGYDGLDYCFYWRDPLYW